MARSALFAFELDGREDFRLFKLFAIARAGWLWGVDAVYVVAPEIPSEFRIPEPGYCVMRVDSLDEVVGDHPAHQVVVVEQGGEPLPGFRHPDLALYLFGSDGKGTIPRKGADHVSVPGRGSMYAHQAATIVAWDRFQR